MTDVRNVRAQPDAGAVTGGRLSVPTRPPVSGPSFASVLASKLEDREGIRFSAHAQQRLRERPDGFGDEEAARLADAVARADQKGARESLVLLDDLALLVSIKNRTVITAVDGQRAKDSVFTNIDSVVIG